MLSNCGHDEYNRYSGGKAGDQTGTEYRLIPWYNGSWNEAFVHPNAKVRAAIADSATKAAQNDHIGYDQSQRLTFFEKLRAAGWYPEKIATDCEADCSSSSAANVIAAGYRCGDKKLQKVNPACVTSNIGGALVAAGFKKFTAGKYLNSGAYLPKGTVLNRSSGHVVVVVTDGQFASETLSLLGTVTAAKTSAMAVKQAQQYLISHGFSCGACGVDGDYGIDSRRASIKHVQKTLNMLGAGIEVDGIAGKKTNLAWQSYGPVKKGCMSYSLTRCVQVALMLHGISCGKAGIDGDCGNDTEAAIRAFQRAYGLDCDGVVGPATFAKLF